MKWSHAITSAALLRAEQRMTECRTSAPTMNSKRWHTAYVPRYEWHREWLDHGREVMATLQSPWRWRLTQREYGRLKNGLPPR